MINQIALDLKKTLGEILHLIQKYIEPSGVEEYNRYYYLTRYLEELAAHLSSMNRLRVSKDMTIRAYELATKIKDYLEENKNRANLELVMMEVITIIRQLRLEGIIEVEPLYSAGKLYNTEEFYEVQINKAKEQIKELKDVKDKLTSETEKKDEELSNLEEQIKLQSSLIEQFKAEAAEKKRQEDLRKEWENKITDSFQNLSELDVLGDEKKRLKKLFCGFIWCFILSSIILGGYLYYTSFIFEPTVVFPFWGYSLKVIPITLFIALIWISVVQFNRAQRQLMDIAHFEHELKYIEKLLLTLNSLSPDMNKSVEIITDAIKKLIDNSIDRKGSHKLSESKIKELDNKDLIPADLMIKILKEVKGLSK